MLKKLFKYEYKATMMTFGALYLAIILTALFMGVSIRFSSADMTFTQMGSAFAALSLLGANWAGAAAVIAMLCYGCLVIAMFVVLATTIIQRFHKNLLGNEGYLMHTLPVQPAMLIVSKMLVALLWTVLSVVTLIVSMVVLYFTLTVGFAIDYSYWRQQFSYLEFDMSFWSAIPVFVGAFFSTLLAVYLAMLVGHQVKKGKMIVAILAYFLLNNFKIWLAAGIADVVNGSFLAQIVYNMPMFVSYFFVMLLQLGFATLYFWGTEYLLRVHLNLE